MSDREIFKFFPEPVFKYKFDKFEEFNKELTDYIYKLQSEDNEGLSKSNRGGWHSKNFKLNDKNSIQFKFALELQKYILDVFQNYGWKTEQKKIQIKEMWAIINKKNDFNVIHTHPNCYLSSAYYVRAPKNCGKFLLENPNQAQRHYFPQIANKNELNMPIAGFDVSEGDLLLFPGYLPHKVAKNESDEDRIVISFNVNTE
tara:strand:- start:8926 stop:9528 length:603 start_codon:yes stop_codon:yes gene_type:complete